MGRENFNASGVFTVPKGVTRVTVEAWGGGGGGAGGSQILILGHCGGGGGGGGAYARKVLDVIEGKSYEVFVGPGGSGSLNGQHGGTGGTTFFDSLEVVRAAGGFGGQPLINPLSGGAGGAGGQAAFCIGDLIREGGRGGKGSLSNILIHSSDCGGGGGSGADDTSSGQNGGNAEFTVPGAGGIGLPRSGRGGDGGTGDVLGGFDGSFPAGGGGGGSREGSLTTKGGDGSRGRVVITWDGPATKERGSGARGTRGAVRLDYDELRNDHGGAGADGQVVITYTTRDVPPGAVNSPGVM